MIAKSVLAALALAASASAQTFTSCNPTNTTCPADPALGSKKIDCDFTKGECADIKVLDGTELVYDSKLGARFTIKTEKDAPTVASSKYIFFGRVEVVCQAAPGQGIVSSIVLQSDDLDEIDWEWIGGDDKKVQTNYFGKGNTTTYDRGKYHDVKGGNSAEHKYTIEWTSDRVEWLVDDVSVRTLPYAEAVGGTQFPQSPMQIKLGTWIGGLKGKSQGTIDWAGGLTDLNKGPFHAYYKSITVVDYAGGKEAPKESIKEYVYGDKSGSFESIKVVKGEPEDDKKKTTTSAAAAETNKTGGSETKTGGGETKGETKTGGAADATKTGSDSKPTETEDCDDEEETGSNGKPTGTKTGSDSKPTGTKTGSGGKPDKTKTGSGSEATETEDCDEDDDSEETGPNGKPTGKPTGKPSGTDSGEKPNETKPGVGKTTEVITGETTSTIYTTSVHTITQCPPEVKDCPAHSTKVVTSTIAVTTTVCPFTSTVVKDTPSPPKTGSGEKPAVTTTPAPVVTGQTTSTIYSTAVHTVTKCPPEVKDCPADSTTKVTTTVPVTTTVIKYTSTLSDQKPAATTTKPGGGSNKPGEKPTASYLTSVETIFESVAKPPVPTGGHTLVTTVSAPPYGNGTVPQPPTKAPTTPAQPSSTVPVASGAGRVVTGLGMVAGFAAVAALIL